MAVRSRLALAATETRPGKRGRVGPALAVAGARGSREAVPHREGRPLAALPDAGVRTRKERESHVVRR
ncbi:TPA: hypothetical protein ONC18_004730 [Enterobacter kobei]|nr:hypothetical protein [Enterobacter kobei]